MRQTAPPAAKLGDEGSWGGMDGNWIDSRLTIVLGSAACTGHN